jgi:hypothetical protein
MNWRQLLRGDRYNRAEDCLAGFTVEEFQAAARALDNGDQAPADALVDRADEQHERCVAAAVLQFVGIDASEVEA